MKRKHTVIVRTTETESKLLKAKADKFTNGNYSEFLRLAILRWEPELSEEEKEQARQIKKYLKKVV